MAYRKSMGATTHWVLFQGSFKFYSPQQQKYYFQNLENLGTYIKNWGKYSDSTIAYLLADYREDTDPTVIWMDEHVFSLIPNKIEDLDNYLVSKGCRSIADQMASVSSWPEYIQWIAWPETTMVLSYLLSFLNLLAAEVVMTAAESEAYWATNGVSQMPDNVKMALKDLYFTPSIRDTFYKMDMLKQIKKMHPGDMNKFYSIIKAYKLVVPNADDIAHFYLAMIRGFPEFIPLV
jgi:hypothetical protein